jgi:hypothetical protein
LEIFVFLAFVNRSIGEICKHFKFIVSNRSLVRVSSLPKFRDSKWVIDLKVVQKEMKKNPKWIAKERDSGREVIFSCEIPRRSL